MSRTCWCRFYAGSLMRCSNCHSDNITRLSLIFNRGTAHTTARTTGFVGGLAGGGGFGGLAGSTTRGVTQSTSAMHASPPAKMQYRLWPAAFVVSIIFLASAIHASAAYGFMDLALCGLSAWRFTIIRKFNTTVWPSQYAEWEKAYQCERCGEIMFPIMDQMKIVSDPPIEMNANEASRIGQGSSPLPPGNS